MPLPVDKRSPVPWCLRWVGVLGVIVLWVAGLLGRGASVVMRVLREFVDRFPWWVVFGGLICVLECLWAVFCVWMWVVCCSCFFGPFFFGLGVVSGIQCAGSCEPAFAGYAQ